MAHQPIPGMDTEIVLPDHLIGVHEGNDELVDKFEDARRIILEIEQNRANPRLHEIIKGKNKKGKLSYVRGRTGAPSVFVSNLLKECDDLRGKIIEGGANAMAVPAPIATWVAQNK